METPVNNPQTTEPVVETTAAPNPAQNAQAPSSAELHQLSMLNTFLGSASKTAREAGELADKFKKVPAQTPTQNTPTTETTAQPAVTTEETPAVDEVQTEGGVKITLQSATAKPAAAKIYNTPQEAMDALTGTFGIKAATPTEFVEAATKAFSGHRAAAQEAGELKNFKKDIEGTFEKMPEDLLQSFTAWTKGEDYKAPLLQEAGIDFNKPAEKQDTKALINKFFPGQFTEEDFTNNTEETPNPAIKIAEAASLDKFKTIKSQRETAAQAKIDSQKLYKQAFDASVEASVSRITEELPYYTDKAPIPVIQSEMSKLYQLRGTVLEPYFLDADGKALPGAAARLAMLKDGQSIIKAIVGRESSKAASKALEEVVTRGADAPSQTAGHNVNNGNQVNPIVKKIQEMTVKRKSVYS